MPIPPLFALFCPSKKMCTGNKGKERTNKATAAEAARRSRGKRKATKSAPIHMKLLSLSRFVDFFVLCCCGCCYSSCCCCDGDGDCCSTSSSPSPSPSSLIVPAAAVDSLAALLLLPLELLLPSFQLLLLLFFFFYCCCFFLFCFCCCCCRSLLSFAVSIFSRLHRLLLPLLLPLSLPPPQSASPSAKMPPRPFFLALPLAVSFQAPPTPPAPPPSA